MKLFDVYSLYPIEPVRGRGNYVYTADGTEYLDLYGGHAVISIGHADPRYVKAIADQAAALGFYSNSVENSLQQRLADLLGQLSGYDDYQLFLCNSGAEANENAMKLASFVTGRDAVLAISHAFHGRTSGAVAATDNPRIQAPFNAVHHVSFTPLNDLEAAAAALSTRKYAAVIVEGIQGVAGIHEPTDEFLRGLRELCDSTGTMMIADEIQSGYGRTGHFFAHQRSGVRPDMVTMAKGIANGFPVGAVLIAPGIEPSKGMLGTTFGGSHLACAAAIATAEVMLADGLMQRAAEIGRYLIERLNTLKDRGLVCDVRGRGLMIGIDVAPGRGAETRRRLLFDHRIFTGGAGDSTVRLLPALTVGKAEADRFLTAFESLLTGSDQ